MIQQLGFVRPGSTIRIPFNSFDKDDGSSITMTNYVAADILVYKDGSTTERASTSGFTATTDFDSKTGKHLAVIDLSDNTTAGFWSVGSEYVVAIDAVTVDAVTVGGWIARFTIGTSEAILNTTIATVSSQTSITLTAGPAEDDAINGMWGIIHDVASAVQMATFIVSDYVGSTKTVTLAVAPTFTIAATDGFMLIAPAPLQSTVAARPLDVSAGGEAGVDWANVGSPTTTLALTGTTIASLTNAPTAGDLTSTMKASVNAEVLDVLNTDTFAEPGQGTPAATTTLAAKINYLYKSWRNKKTQTSTTLNIFADDTTTVDQKSTVSDDGTTTTVGEIATGP